MNERNFSHSELRGTAERHMFRLWSARHTGGLRGWPRRVRFLPVASDGTSTTTYIL
jgi:hypothetical protein